MHFLFNTTSYKPAYQQGGPVISVSGLAEELVRMGHQVTVVASNRDLGRILNVVCDQDHRIKGVRVRYFETFPTLLQRTGLKAFANSTIYTYGNKLTRWLEEHEHGFDLVDNQISFTQSNGAIASYAHAHGIPAFYHQRGNLDPKRLAYGRLKKLVYIWIKERPIMQRADMLIALTDYEAGSYRRLKLTNRIEVIPNGITDQLLPHRALCPSAQVQTILDNVGEFPVFLFMSRIHPIKGSDVFVEAFLRCARTCPTVRGIMAGPDEGHMMNSLLHEVKKAGLSSRFFYAGALGGDDKLAVLARADGFVLPTESEGFSMVLLEALSSRCAIITTPGAYFDEIAHCGAGEIVSKTPGAVSEAMIRLASKGRTGMAGMGENGLNLVRQKFTWPVIAKRYARFAEETVQQKKKKRMA